MKQAIPATEDTTIGGSMEKVNSVLGPIHTRDLGITLIHEHLIAGLAGWRCDALAVPYDRKEIARACVAELSEVRQLGLESLLDATPIDQERDVELARMVSEETGVNIIVCTGMYTEQCGANGYFLVRQQLFDIAQELYETFMKEITQGIADTGVRAGAIKVATGASQITEYERSVFAAAAKAQRETGVPIITHTTDGTMGPEQVDLLVAEGANPRQIAVGHMCANTDVNYHTAVIGKEAYSALDQFGNEMQTSDADRINIIVNLLKKGGGDRILISHDHVTQLLGRPWELPPELGRSLANWKKTHILQTVIPALKRSGITEEQVKLLLADNPARLFTG